MIKVKIREAARKRGLENAYQFGKDVGFSNRVATRIWDNDQPPKLKTLDRICNAWECELSELIEHKFSRNGHTSTAPRKPRLPKTNGLIVKAKPRRSKGSL